MAPTKRPAQAKESELIERAAEGKDHQGLRALLIGKDNQTRARTDGIERAFCALSKDVSTYCPLCVGVLLEAGATPPDMCVPLLCAAGGIEGMRMLKKANVDLAAENPLGESALHFMSAYPTGQMEVMWKFLLGEGLDPHRTDCEYLSALDHAHDLGYGDEAERVMAAFLAEQQAKNISTSTPEIAGAGGKPRL